jgi:hypothetical protein
VARVDAQVDRNFDGLVELATWPAIFTRPIASSTP